jgi:hypothetical protein
VEVGKHFARQWRAFFTRLENHHDLDHKDSTHLWLLQRLFLKDINSDCQEFIDEWNAHSIEGEGNKSPNVSILSHLQCIF